MFSPRKTDRGIITTFFLDVLMSFYNFLSVTIKIVIANCSVQMQSAIIISKMRSTLGKSTVNIIIHIEHVECYLSGKNFILSDFKCFFILVKHEQQILALMKPNILKHTSLLLIALPMKNEFYSTTT